MIPRQIKYLLVSFFTQRNRYVYFSLIIFFIFTSAHFAQRYPVKNYTEENGLPSSMVYDVERDSTGVAWFATRNGIASFNASEWRNYKAQEGLVKPDYSCLKVDGNGDLWALHKSVIIQKYDRNKDVWLPPIKIPIGKPGSIAKTFDIKVGTDTTIVIVLRRDGLLLYQNKEWNHITVNSGLIGDEVNDVFISKDEILVAAEKGISIIDDNLNIDNNLSKKLNSSFKSLLAISRYFNPQEKSADEFLILSHKGILKLSGNEFQVINSSFNIITKDEDERNSIVGPYCDKIFFGTNKTLYEFDQVDQKVQILDDGNGLNVGGVFSFLIDSENILWIASGGGVSKISSFRFSNIKEEQGLFKNDVSSIVELSPNRMLIGHPNGISIYDEGKFKKIKLSEETILEPVIDRILDMHKDKAGNIWIAAENLGFAQFISGEGIKWLKDAGPGKENASSIAEDESGNIYLTTEEGLLKKTSRGFIKINTPSSMASYVRKVFYYNNRLMIATSSSGIFIKGEDEKWINIRNDDNEYANNVFSIFPVRAGKYFIGTIDGLYLLSDGEYKKFAHANGFHIDRPVYFIIKDNQDIVWFGTDKGVVLWDGENSYNFSSQLGLAGLETSRDAAVIDSEGQVWIGTNRGISIYYPEYELQTNLKPHINLLFVDAKEKRQSLNEKIVLENDENDLEFYFNSPSLINEGLNVYEALLEGYDNHWVTVNNYGIPKIRYTNLSAGEYRFKVRSRNALGTYSEEAVSSLIVIKLPFYQTVWFTFTLIAGFVWIVIVIVRYVSRGKYSKQLEKEVRERTKKLMESEDRYVSLLTSIQDGIYVNQNGKLNYVNEAFASMLGYTVEEVTGRDYKDFIAPENIDLVVKKYEHRVREKQENEQYEVIFLHKDKRTRIYGSINAGIYKFGGDTASIGTVKNITEIRASHEQLKKLSTAVKQSPVSVIITDRKGVIEYVNPSFEEITGLNLEEISGRKPTMLISEETDPETYKNLWRQIIVGKPWKGELKNKRKNGENFWARVAISPIKNDDGRITHFIGVLEDVTTEKTLREKIEQNEKIITSVMNHIPILLFALDNDGFITFVRGRVLNYFKFTPDDVLGIQGKTLFANYPEIADDIERALVGESFSVIREVRGKSFKISFTPFIDNQNKHRGSIGVAYDISDIIEAKKTITESNERIKGLLLANPDMIFEFSKEGEYLNLHAQDIGELILPPEELIGKKLHDVVPKQVADRALDAIGQALSSGKVQIIEYDLRENEHVKYYEARINKSGIDKVVAVIRDVTEVKNYQKNILEAKEKAEKSDQLKSEFLAQMSHEIRTPLNSILSFSQLIKSELESKISDELKDGFQMIENGSQRLTRTIDLILDMSQIQTGSVDLNMKEINLDSELLRTVISQLKPQAASNNLYLNYESQTTDSIINGDQYTLGQIFINLIDNAIKYTKEGGITVTLLQEGNKLKVKVSDTGIGMSEKFIPNLFTPFSQEETGYTRRFEGTGLGLALVKKYVEYHNGTIEVSSHKGKGTTFTVSFDLIN
ncbi:MAG: PAS domain S-box protein [Melioribacteraceae bacterium]|nr:PAS domain S-box protein [Melioribacteraceae bacterium]MCF8354829.1 PAS domain S-box protein [Melioribacteraceae bacterium]MCF8394540.1 PAS domain S-box protein [Melioribacteraceae bacterium]MCF8420199.1 PAS domain S-box protein [Melioribacteraceae bacterium]